MPPAMDSLLWWKHEEYEFDHEIERRKDSRYLTELTVFAKENCKWFTTKSDYVVVIQYIARPMGTVCFRIHNTSHLIWMAQSVFTAHFYFTLSLWDHENKEKNEVLIERLIIYWLLIMKNLHFAAGDLASDQIKSLLANFTDFTSALGSLLSYFQII